MFKYGFTLLKFINTSTLSLAKDSILILRIYMFLYRESIEFELGTLETSLFFLYLVKRNSPVKNDATPAIPK